MVIDGRSRIAEWIGSAIDEPRIDDFAGRLEGLGFDPLSERGEYHKYLLSIA